MKFHNYGSLFEGISLFIIINVLIDWPNTNYSAKDCIYNIIVSLQFIHPTKPLNGCNNIPLRYRPWQSNIVVALGHGQHNVNQKLSSSNTYSTSKTMFYALSANAIGNRNSVSIPRTCSFDHWILPMQR